MEATTPNREDSLALLREYNKDESHIKHALAVEATMRHFAALRGEDPDKWGVIGLMHDLDWEKHPEVHCTVTKRVLKEHGWPDEYVRAIMSHAWGMFSDIKPEHPMEKILYTIDELTGLIVATALVRPSRSLSDLTAKSVRKKWKEKSFAAGVDRSVIERGVEMMGEDLNSVVEATIEAMRGIGPELGLA